MVNETQKRIIFWGLILILFILVLPQLSSLSIAQGNVLSIGQVSLATETGDQSNQVFKAQVLLGTGADQIRGSVSSPSTILETATGQRSTNGITISYNLNKEIFKYPLTQLNTQPQYKKLSGINFELKSNYDYGYSIIPDGTHYLSPTCAYNVFGALGALTQTKVVQGGTGVYVPSTCINEYKAICNHNGGTIVVSSTAINLLNLASIPTNGYKCLKMENDESKSTINYLRPKDKEIEVEATISVTKSNGGSETLILSNIDQVKTGNNVRRIAMKYGVDSFAPDAPEYSSFYVTRVGTNLQLLQPSKYDEIVSSVPNIQNFDGGSESNLVTSISNYNAKLDSVLISGQTGFSGTEEINRIVYSDSMAILDRTSYPSTFPVLDIEIDADWLGIYRPVATGSVSLSQNSIQIREGGSGGSLEATVTRQGEGSINLNPPTCTPSGVISNPSSTVSIYQSGQKVTYNIRGNEGTYQCSVDIKDDNGNLLDSESFAVEIDELCTKTPINLQVLDADVCTLSCPINTIECGAGNYLDVSQCKCVGQSPSQCTNTCPSGNLRKAYPDCSCYIGTCQPDLTTQIEGSIWNTVECRWKCPDGMVAIIEDDGGISCQSGLTQEEKEIDWLDYLLYGLVILLALVVVYLLTRKKVRKR